MNSPLKDLIVISSKHKRNRKENWILLFELIIIVCLCLFRTLLATFFIDFYPINGTFQNFNPVRRFLNGQIPYTDFQDYLGLGHLYFGTIFTFLLGGTYKNSLIAFSFLQIIPLILIFYTVGKSVFNHKLKSLSITTFLLLILFIKPSPLNHLNETFLNSLSSALSIRKLS